MQTIQFNVDNHYSEVVINLLNNLNDLKRNIISDLAVISHPAERDTLSAVSRDRAETEAFANHAAGTIREWQDDSEDAVWI